MNVEIVEGGIEMVSQLVVWRSTQRASVGASRMTRLAMDIFPRHRTDVTGILGQVLIKS